MLDAICVAYYGQAHRYVEAVLEHNPDMLELGPRLPAGIVITLPSFPDLKETRNTISLWE